jgi:hypothetical protein
MLWFFSPIGRGAELLLSNMLLFQAIGYLCFLPGYLWSFASVIRWYALTRKSAKYDLPMPVAGRRLARLRNNALLAGILLLLVCMVAGVVLEIAGGMPVAISLIALLPLSALGVGLWIRKQIDTRRRTRAGNIGLAVAALIVMEVIIIGGTIWAIMNMPFSSDAESLGSRAALALSDVGDESAPSRSRTYINGTIAVPVDYEHYEYGGEGSVSTQVYRTVNGILTAWLYDCLAQEFAARFTDWMDINSEAQDTLAVLSEDEADWWDAEKGMSFQFAGSNAIELLLTKDKTILRLSADGTNMSAQSLRRAVHELWVWAE